MVIPTYLSDFPRGKLPKYFKDKGFKKGAEIGIYKGKFVEKFLQEGLEMYAVDSFLPGIISQTDERAEYIKSYARKVLNKFPNCKLLEMNSMEASKKVQSETLDFVYIDADHSFKGIAGDLYEWYFKVKQGGIIAGHDYEYTGSDERARKNFQEYSQVKQVVDAFVEAFKIKEFYVFGRSKNIELESKNDRYLSYMFIKP